MQDPDLVLQEASAHVRAAMQEPSLVRRFELLEEGLRLNRLATQLRKSVARASAVEAG